MWKWSEEEEGRRSDSLSAAILIMSLVAAGEICDRVFSALYSTVQNSWHLLSDIHIGSVCKNVQPPCQQRLIKCRRCSRKAINLALSLLRARAKGIRRKEKDIARGDLKWERQEEM